MNSDLLTGDVVCIQWLAPSATWFNRLTSALTGSVSHHNELVVDIPAGLRVGNATWSGFELKPWADRLREIEDNTARVAVYRWHAWCEPDHIDWYLGCRKALRWILTAWADARIPYDKRGILSFGRNWLRARLGLKLLARQAETRYWCTESCVRALRLVGVELLAALGHQPLPAPVHIERLVQSGELVLVRDYGLNQAILTNRALKPVFSSRRGHGGREALKTPPARSSREIRADSD